MLRSGLWRSGLRLLGHPFEPRLVYVSDAPRPQQIVEPRDQTFLSLLRGHLAPRREPFEEPRVVGVDAPRLGAPSQAARGYELEYLGAEGDPEGLPAELRTQTEVRASSLDDNVLELMAPGGP